MATVDRRAEKNVSHCAMENGTPMEPGLWAAPYGCTSCGKKLSPTSLVFNLRVRGARHGNQSSKTSSTKNENARARECSTSSKHSSERLPGARPQNSLGRKSTCAHLPKTRGSFHRLPRDSWCPRGQSCASSPALQRSGGWRRRQKQHCRSPIDPAASAASAEDRWTKGRPHPSEKQCHSQKKKKYCNKKGRNSFFSLF